MEADCSYNDLRGTISVDITDHGTNDNELGEALEQHGINQKEFKAIGLHSYCGYEVETNCIDVDIVLKDLSKEDRLVKKSLTLTIPEFFGLFKRIDIYLMEKYFRHDDLHIDHIERIE